MPFAVRLPHMSDGKPVLTVGITTRNRHDSLQRCMESLRFLDHLSPEILIFDDASDVPVADTVIAQPRLRIIRDDRGPGNIVGRNTLMAQASADAVLLLDDDAALLEAAGIERALEILSRDSDVAAIAFAQANEDGGPWPETMQPGLGRSPRYVAAFIGFAHLLRRDVFLRLGGYRERFVFYGEEKEYCLRLLDRGLRVVYLPDTATISAVRDAQRLPERAV
jgi:GT2 family glycosyltransferase